MWRPLYQHGASVWWAGNSRAEIPLSSRAIQWRNMWIMSTQSIQIPNRSFNFYPVVLNKEKYPSNRKQALKMIKLINIQVYVVRYLWRTFNSNRVPICLLVRRSDALKTPEFPRDLEIEGRPFLLLHKHLRLCSNGYAVRSSSSTEDHFVFRTWFVFGFRQQPFNSASVKIASEQKTAKIDLCSVTHNKVNVRTKLDSVHIFEPNVASLHSTKSNNISSIPQKNRMNAIRSRIDILIELINFLSPLITATNVSELALRSWNSLC